MEWHRALVWGRRFSLCFWSLIYRNLLIPGWVAGAPLQTSLIAHSGFYANNFRGGIVWLCLEGGNEPCHEFAMRQKCFGV